MSISPDHLTLRRLIMRMMLLACERESHDSPDATWPAIVMARIASRERMNGDGFRRKMTVSVRRSEILMHNGKAERDKNGDVKYVWIEGPEEVMDTGCHYGSYVRMIATSCGFELKGLTEWEPEEVSAMVIACAKMLGAEGGADVKARAEAFPDWPSGWEEAVEDGLQRSEERAT